MQQVVGFEGVNEGVGVESEVRRRLVMNQEVMKSVSCCFEAPRMSGAGDSRPDPPRVCSGCYLLAFAHG